MRQLNRPTSNDRAAFTLIELLVVIAIIAILAAILFPVFAQARDKARSAMCLSHSKQVGVSVMMYVQDYDEIYPKTYYYEPSGRRVQWAYYLQPYVKNNAIFKCPTDFTPTPPQTSSGLLDLTVPELSYIPNYAVMPAHDGGTVSMSAIGETANVIILAEKQYKIGTKTLKPYAGTSGFYPDTPVASPYCKVTADRVKAAIAKPSDSNYKLARVAFKRHQEGSNFIFCDGHAKFHHLADTLGTNFMWGEYYYAGGGQLLDDATCATSLPAN